MSSSLQDNINAAATAAANIAETLAATPASHPIFSSVDTSASEAAVAAMPNPALTPDQQAALSQQAASDTQTANRQAQVVHFILQFLPLVQQFIVPALKTPLP